MSDFSIATIAGLCGFVLTYILQNPQNSNIANQLGGGISAELRKAVELFLNKSGPPKLIKNFDEIPDRLKYHRVGNYELKKPLIHVGQLKLFLGELEFLTEHYPKRDDNMIMVYAGSSPCHHASYLSKMFPNLKIVMIDPNEHWIFYPDHKTHYSSDKLKETVYFKCSEGNRFKVKDRHIQMFDGTSVTLLNRDTDQVKSISDNFLKKIDDKDYLTNYIDFIADTDYKYYIIEDLFTNKLAEFFSNLSSFVFCSDIRTNIHSEESKTETTFGEESPSDLDILWNSAMQYNWINIMQPKSVMLKFRCPFFNPEDKKIFNEYLRKPDFRQDDFDLAKKNGIDFLNDYSKNKFKYYQQYQIYLQAFPGMGSAETRFVTSEYSKIAEIDVLNYEERLFYYNNVSRLFGFHSNYKIFDNNYGIDGCTDCALMHKIFENYYNKYFPKGKDNIKNDIINLLKTIKRTLVEHGSHHGKLIKKKTISDAMKIFESK